MDKDIIVEHRSHLLGHGMNFVANIPTVFHCHHFNLFWDQTIDDALGHELSCRIRTAAAREVSSSSSRSAAARTSGCTSATGPAPT